MTKRPQITSLIKRQFSLKTDYLITSANGLAVLIGVFVLNGLIARKYGLEVLGEFLLVKRTTLSLIGILLLGMNIGLPSMLGRSKDRKLEVNAFLLYAIYTIPLIAVVVFIVRMGLIPGFTPSNSFAYGLFMLGITMQAMIYGIYRGHLKMIGANGLQFLGTAMLPIVVFSFLGDLSTAFMIIGIGMLLLSSVAYSFQYTEDLIAPINIGKLKKLMKFGFDRYISFIAQFMLLAGSPLLVSFYNPYSDLAYFNSLISIVRLFLFVIGPLGVVILPRIGRSVQNNSIELVGEGIGHLLELIILVSGVMALFLSSMGGEILKLWLGSVSESGDWMASIILLTIPFYLVAEILRSPIDGLSDKGYNSIIYFIAAASLVIVFFGSLFFNIPVLNAGVYSFFVGYLVSAFGSVIVIRRMTGLPIPGVKYIVKIMALFGGSLLILGVIETSTLGIIPVVGIKLAAMASMIIIILFLSMPQLKQLNSISDKL